MYIKIVGLKFFRSKNWPVRKFMYKKILHRKYMQLRSALSRLFKACLRFINKPTRAARKFLARPHAYLYKHSRTYRLTFKKIQRFKARRLVSATILAICGVLAVNLYMQVQAQPDLADSWNFSNPADYTLTSGLETSGSSVRLGAHELLSDVNTAALYSFNETIGNAATDTSGNSNTLTSTVALPWTTTGKAHGGATFNGTAISLSTPDSVSLSLTNNQSIEAWTKFSTGFNSSSSNDQHIVDKGNYKLYFDHTTGKLTYELAGSNNTSTLLTSPWSTSTGTSNITAQAVVGSDVYYGLNKGIYGASVWRYNSTNNTTTQVGGGGLNGSFNNQNYIESMAVNGTTLYAGTGPTSGNTASTVYSCDTSTGCTSWTNLGGFSNLYGLGVTSLYVQGGKLYAGLHGGTDSAKVYIYNNGTSWTQLGGTGSTPTSWTSLPSSGVSALSGDGSSNLYVSIWGSNPQVWKCVISGTTCSSWTAITGSWGASTNKLLTTYSGGNLYALVDTSAGPAVYRYSGSGTVWTKIGYGSGNPWSTSVSTNVLGFTGDGTNLYVSIYASYSAGTYDIWKCANSATTCTWTNVSKTTGTTKNAPAILTYSGTTLYAAGQTNTDAKAYGSKYSAGTWSDVANPNPDWLGYYSSVKSTVSYNNTLYVGLGNKNESDGNLHRGAAVWKQNGASWTQVGGNGANGSWKLGNGEYNNVNSMTVYGGNLYVALGGLAAGDGEVWRYNGSAWTQVGGDGVNTSWNNYINVSSLTVYAGQLYAGLGGAAGDGEVWRYNGSAWTQVGGDGVNSGTWLTSANITTVNAMVVKDSDFYVGIGDSNSTTGRVYKFNGSVWTQLAGSGASSGNWSSAYDVTSLVIYNGQVYAGVKSTASNTATIWQYSGSGTNWTQVGGSGMNGSWTTAYQTIASLAVYNGQLYAGTSQTNPAYTSGGASLWKYGDGSWTNTNINYGQASGISSLATTHSKLIVGSAGYYIDNEGYDQYTSNVFTYGSNLVASSSVSSWDTAWHKIGASYDGANLKLYIDGVLDTTVAGVSAVPDNNLAMLVGSDYSGQGFFAGTMDELRLSNVARASFPALAYSNVAQTVALGAATRKRGVWHWDDWTDDRNDNGGTITYRLSIDNGATWQYWNGSAWTISSSTSQSNDLATLHDQISVLPATSGGITWQAVLQGDGSQQVTLSSVSLASTSDVNAPAINASAIQAKKAASDASFNLTSNNWTSGSSPYLSWTAGNDNESGILGYCLYFGQDNTANPVTTKGMLGASPSSTDDSCQFLTTSTSIDLGTAGYLTTPLVTSDTPYYLLIKAIDKAGNPVGSTTEFHFRFDNTAPTNPSYITAPSGFINSKEVNLTWPISGPNTPLDANSGVAGLQYKINNSDWYGDSHSGNGDINDLLSNDGSYTTQTTPDFTNLSEGINTVYFRTWDLAGNTAQGTVTALIKINTTGAPSEPLDLTATPTTNSVNSFSFTWNRPTSLVGDASNATYCYSVNNLPNSTNCTYTAAGVTSLSAGPYATQPGVNTLYVVSRDESHNINYANYATVDFAANTAAPGLPLNADVADVSIKATRNWRLALTWDIPNDTGTGVYLYKIYRSTDGTNFSLVGTSSSTSYIDSSLTQQLYYYRINACDSANNCSVDSTTARGYPTGKFTSAAILTSEPTVNNITTRKAAINWSTDRTSDSRLSIGTTSGKYDPPETLIADQVTSHSVELTNLSAGTTYYIVARWTDEDGNAGKSQEISFTTSPAPIVKEVTTTKIGLADAAISFTSVGAYKVSIYYGLSDSFGGVKSINTSASESGYDIRLDGLNDGTKYFFQPIAYDSEGNAYPGNVFSFTTPPRPRISNLQFQPVPGEPTSTQQITWTTNVPTNSTITYGVVGSNGFDISKPQMTTSHEVMVNGLQDNSVYFLVAQSRDANGNLSVSDRQSFKTALDTRPPKISNIEVETSIRGTGSQSRGQIIVSWTTDELASSQVAYGTGTSSATLNNKTTEDGAYSTEHIVIISDLPTSELYTIQPLSKDKSNNQSEGISQTAIIGRGSDDVLTIVLNALQKIFGL